MTINAAPKTNKRATLSWALWDWAEQPYPTLMQTFIFPVYLVKAVGANIENPDIWVGWATAIAGVILALIAPVMGRRSDASGRRKFWLLVNTAVLVGITAGSFFVEPKPEYFLLGLVLYGAGSVIQESAFINYYAMLKGVTTDKNIGRISGYAWGLGYVGGIILLLIALVGFYIDGPHWFGLTNENKINIRTMFLLAAGWMVIFTIPLMLFVPEIERKAGQAKESLAESYRKLFKQIASMRKTAPETLKFLIASAVYRDGLAGVFMFGAILGTEAFGFTETTIIYYGIAANVVAAIGAGIGGRLDDIIGSRKVVAGSLFGLTIGAIAIFALAGLGPITYWIFGLMLTLFVGPAQASSRTFVARLTPEGREGEVFGLYQTAGRALSFLSGTMWAISITVANFFIVGGENTIYGIWGIMIVVAAGLVLLLRVSPNPKQEFF